jgi:hypothetical protein
VVAFCVVDAWGGPNREHSAEHVVHFRYFQLQDNCKYRDQPTSVNNNTVLLHAVENKKVLHFIALILRGNKMICSRTLQGGKEET